VTVTSSKEVTPERIRSSNMSVAQERSKMKSILRLAWRVGIYPAVNKYCKQTSTKIDDELLAKINALIEAALG